MFWNREWSEMSSEQMTYTYRPYGALSISGSTTNSYDYTGRESDGLGLYYYRARYYNPTTGRFISEDPAGFMAGPNFYTYVYDDPIDYRDPFGKDPIVGASAGAIMGGFYGAWGAWTTGGNGGTLRKVHYLARA
jgi:RHS repeat-associated protein